jgi:hypothetical protein
MRGHVKGMLFGLSMLMGLLWVAEAAAVPSGGSRLLFYFSNKTFASSGASTNGTTVMSVTNGSVATPTKAGIRFWNGTDCVGTAPVIHDFAPGQTLTFDSKVVIPGFDEGVMEVFNVNGAGAPVRFDQMVGSSVVIDLNMVQAVRLPAAKLYSDDRSATFNTLIADNTAASTLAPIILQGQFLPPSIVTTRLALFAPGTTPGTVDSDRLITVNFRQPDGTGNVDGPLNVACGRTLTLAQIRALTPGAFSMAFPGGGTVTPIVDGQEKGLIGWQIEVAQIPGVTDIMIGTLLQSTGVAALEAHP